MYRVCVSSNGCVCVCVCVLCGLVFRAAFTRSEELRFIDEQLYQFIKHSRIYKESQNIYTDIMYTSSHVPRRRIRIFTETWIGPVSFCGLASKFCVPSLTSHTLGGSSAGRINDVFHFRFEHISLVESCGPPVFTDVYPPIVMCISLAGVTQRSPSLKEELYRKTQQKNKEFYTQD